MVTVVIVKGEIFCFLPCRALWTPSAQIGGGPNLQVADCRLQVANVPVVFRGLSWPNPLGVSVFGEL